MAAHLAARGFDLIVHDRDGAVAERVSAETGSRLADRLDDLSPCSTVLLMLPTSADVRAVLNGPEGRGGLLQALRPGALVIDCSSSDPFETRQLAAEAEARGIGMIDAPVAGGVVFAREGTLDVLIGGPPEAVARAEPILAAFARGTRHCGETGSAHAMKLVGNAVNAQALITYAEAMTLALRFGIAPGTLCAALAESTTGRNHPFGKKIEGQVMSGRFASGMALALIEKDVATALGMAERLALEAPVLETCLRQWRRGVDEIGADADQTEIVRLWEREAGVEIREEQ